VLHKKIEQNPCRDPLCGFPDCEPEFDLALHTGARRTELYSLQWEHLDLERGILTIQGKAHANSRRTRIRYVPINSSAAEALRELHARSRGSAFVFPRGRLARWRATGELRSGAEKEKRDRRLWFEQCVEAAGVSNFRYHDLCHTFASRLRMAGVELADIMEFLGHTSLQMVMRYAHLTPGHQKANIGLLVHPGEAAISGKKPLRTSTIVEAQLSDKAKVS
jgi:integrase